MSYSNTFGIFCQETTSILIIQTVIITPPLHLPSCGFSQSFWYSIPFNPFQLSIQYVPLLEWTVALIYKAMCQKVIHSMGDNLFFVIMCCVQLNLRKYFFDLFLIFLLSSLAPAGLTHFILRLGDVADIGKKYHKFSMEKIVKDTEGIWFYGVCIVTKAQRINLPMSYPCH